MNNKTVIGVLVFVGVLGIGGYIYSQGSAAKKAEEAAMMEPKVEMPVVTEIAPPEAMMEGEKAIAEQTIEVSGGSFYFKPNQIKVKKGDKVTITFRNEDGFHDFVIDELKVKTPTIKTGETASVSFTADQVGSFEFYCSVMDHRAKGMVGTLVVEE